MISTRQVVIVVALLCWTVKAQFATTELPGPQYGDGAQDIDTSTLPTYLVIAPPSSSTDDVNLPNVILSISLTLETSVPTNLQADFTEEESAPSAMSPSVTSTEAQALLTAPQATISTTADITEDLASTPALSSSASTLVLPVQDTTTSTFLSDLTSTPVTSQSAEIPQDQDQSQTHLTDSSVPSSTPSVKMTRIVTTMLTVSGSSTMHTVLTTDVPASILAANIGTSAGERQIGSMSWVVLLATSLSMVSLTYIV
jgi:hypothetical protein